MVLGPVFRAELLRTARRRRYYAIRLIYGFLLLAVIWLGYERTFRGAPSAEINEVAQFAENTFITFGVVQLITILVLIPALFGGAIADEKQRKTLHYLMASRLSSFEIVSDKILGRAPHLAVFLGLGLPVVSLLSLFGGVPLEYVTVAYVGTISTAAFTVAMTVLVSTLVRKVRQAVLIAYVFMLGWQLIPTLLSVVFARLYPATYDWIAPVNEWVRASTPFSVWAAVEMRRGLGPPGTTWLVEQMAWMVGLQVGGAAFLIFLAVWRLRPVFRSHAEARPARTWLGLKKAGPARARRRFWDRPECGDDAMIWKERYFVRTDAFTRMVILPSTVLVSTILVLAVGIDESFLRAVRDFWDRGFREWGQVGEAFVHQIRVASAWYVALWLLAVAGSSASTVTIEREEDTWVSLTSTPLTGREILRGKVIGVFWAQRGFGAIPIGLWSIGLLTGTIHPIGFLGSVLLLALITGMVVVIGLHASLRASSTSRALASTITTLVVLCGYPVFILWSFLEGNVGENYTPFVGLPARLVVGPLVSYGYVATEWHAYWQSGFLSLTYSPYMIGGMILTAIYGSIAGVLTFLTVGRFDARLDRPRISFEDRAVGVLPLPKPEAGQHSAPQDLSAISQT